MSTEIARLVSLDYLQLRDDSQLRPKVIYEEQGPAAETLINKTIRAALAKGPVLVQVSAVGHSVSVYCKACSEKVLCRECSGPLWLDAGAKPICRWCNALNYGAACNNCGSRDLKQGRAGSSRSVAEFGKAFPGIRVLESTSAARVETMPNKSALVVATPGCEPIAENGYAAVVLLDARNQIGRDSLRSVEDAVSAWANAVSLLGEGGTAVLVGLGGKLAEQFVLWQQQAIAEQQLQERAELSLPPVVRLGSITGQPEAAQRIAEVATEIGATVLGPTKVDAMNVQYIMKYAYKIGAELAMQLKVAQLKTGAGRNQRTQRNERLVRVKMDDRQVI
jgi:primosomal protein N' (replication factor Y)